MIKRKKTLLILFLSIIIWNQDYIIFSQQAFKKPDKREIILSKRDTIIKAYVMIGVSMESIQKELEYTWFGNNRINSNQGNYSGKLLHGVPGIY